MMMQSRTAIASAARRGALSMVARPTVSSRRSLRVSAAAQYEASDPSRRSLLAAVSAVTAGVAGISTTAAAARAAELQTATNGLQWVDTKEGSGPSPAKGSVIRCHYTGKLYPSGTVFDSSLPRGQPLQFTIGVGQVIKGWDLGILGSTELGIPAMKEGGTRELRIPADLGYGQRGAGGVIPPGATLDFTVELLPAKK